MIESYFFTRLKLQIPNPTVTLIRQCLLCQMLVQGGYKTRPYEFMGRA